MFNLSGSELIFLVVIALVVLGPDKLPEAMRKAGKAYADFKKMTTGFQNEMKSVLDEPLRELRETAELAKQSAMFDINDKAAAKPVAASAADDSMAPDPARLSPRDLRFGSAEPPKVDSAPTVSTVADPVQPSTADFSTAEGTGSDDAAPHNGEVPA